MMKNDPAWYSTRRVPSAEVPRCEAWGPARGNRPVARCPNAGTFWRGEHRVCMQHQQAQRVAFSAEEAERLPLSR